MSDFTDPTHWAVNEFADADLGDPARHSAVGPTGPYPGLKSWRQAARSLWQRYHGQSRLSVL